jgi:putative protease
LNNGDTLTYFDLQKELRGFRVNTAEKIDPLRYRAFPNESIKDLKDLRKDVALNRSRDMAWERLMESDRSSERKIPLHLWLRETETGLQLDLMDDEGVTAGVSVAHPSTPSKDPDRQEQQIRDALSKLGGSDYRLEHLSLHPAHDDSFGFYPASVLNGLRRSGIEALDHEREVALPRLERSPEAHPKPCYPEDTLSYLANVYNGAAQRFYLSHGVRIIDAAYESHEEKGDVSLMITKHCIRFSLSLCPKQTKGVLGVQGTIRAEPLVLVNGNERLTLQFDCKACEMHVVGKIKRHVLKDVPATPIQFYRKKPDPSVSP